MVADLVAEYGHVIVDECHHLSAHSFEQVARQAKARFVLGLSATVARKDGHHPIIFMQCGPVRHQVNARAQAASRPFEHFVLVQPTPFQPNRNPDPDKRVEFQTLYQELIDDQARTRRICEDVIDSVRNGRSPLILTERNDHLDRFEQELATRVDHVVVLRAGMGKKQRQAVNERLAAIPRHEGRIILATGKYVGEGFDDPRLDTLFLTLPVSWRGTVAQYAGRLHRLYDGKREVRIYDYADLNVPMLARMFDRRCRGYEAIGYTILLPASAVPGWPADVVLPSDPVWKRDYSGSVRRLIRDGVDTPLASLFVHAARAMPEDAEGAARARSATEAFLYRRLDTLTETSGRFRLNVALPIPFDGFGTLEVDLLCADARVAIELDGGQHLADPVAYRRDRRKDQLLQENGYFVLRFLAEDVGKELDAVLDAILRVLARRRQSADEEPSLSSSYGEAVNEIAYGLVGARGPRIVRWTNTAAGVTISGQRRSSRGIASGSGRIPANDGGPGQGHHGAKCGEKDGISWGSSGVPAVISGQRCPAITCIQSFRIKPLEPIHISHNVAGGRETALLGAGGRFESSRPSTSHPGHTFCAHSQVARRVNASAHTTQFLDSPGIGRTREYFLGVRLRQTRISFW